MASQAPSPDCLNNDLCAFVYEKTGLGWLADTANYALVKPARILLIIVAALVLRYVIRRMIKRVTRSAGAERRLGLFHPLRERMPASLQEATRVRSERRQQRAEALGSVLQSIASVTIFSIATMMVLSEFGVELAPLLASAGIVGVALGFGAQNLVKDLIAGLFMLLEDQYGVGDVIDLGDVGGTVEAVGLRITTIRDARGVLWYIRNGEIIRVGNQTQGWAVVVVDVPIGFAGVEEATEVLNTAAATLATRSGVRRSAARGARGARRGADQSRWGTGTDDGEDRVRGAVAGRTGTAPPPDRGPRGGRHRPAPEFRPHLRPTPATPHRHRRPLRQRRRRPHLTVRASSHRHVWLTSFACQAVRLYRVRTTPPF